MDSELARLHRDTTCPFFAAAPKAKALTADSTVLKLDDGMQIPMDEVAEIIESITFDDVPNGNYMARKIIAIFLSIIISTIIIIVHNFF